MELSENGKKQKRGYQPGDDVTGTVRANYFFGKPVDSAELSMKASTAAVAVVEVASAEGKTDSEGTYHFDLKLPKYFAEKPLSQGAARVLIEATVKDSAGHSETRGEPTTVSDSPLLITAIPEGGTLVPNLENELFVLTSYPDGTPAKADVTVRSCVNWDQHVATDDGGIAIVPVKAKAGKDSFEIEARDQEGNEASTKVELQAREGEDQILPLSIEVAFDRTHLAQDDIVTESATVKNNLTKAANMVMVDLGIPPGFDLLSEDLQDYQEKSAHLKSGHWSKFSLTATQALLYFDSFAPGDEVSLKFRLRAMYPIRARTFKSRVYEYYDPEVSSVARPVQLEVARR